MNDRSQGERPIRTPDQRLRVFVSSAPGELTAERQAAGQAIRDMRLTPVMFETGARPHRPRDLYRAYLAQSDVFIGLYGQRYGDSEPGQPASGLQEEFDLSAGMPRLLYVKDPAPGREPRLSELLDRIRDEASVSYRHFQDAAELGALIREDLAVLLSERFASSGPGRAAPAAPPSGARALPAGTTSLVGREQAIADLAGLLTPPGAHLVTLTGPGGIGKTRLALAAAERLTAEFGAATVFVPLAAVTQPDLVVGRIARTVGSGLARAGSPLEALAEQLGDDRWLLILDNLEQVVEVARDLGDLLARCSGLVILATSRTVLGLRAEREYPVPPLSLPADPAGLPLAELAASPAVALFTDRARAVRYDFALTEANAAAVAEICRRLEGVPLAIELAAARIRILEPTALLGRLSRSLDELGTGMVDRPERQRTLRATVEWSVGLLEDAERSLLEVAAVFVDGWTVEGVARVAAQDPDRALELMEELARHSLVSVEQTPLGPRCRMLETIRVFVGERLAARPDMAEIQHRHASHYLALAEAADRPLRGARHQQWLDRLQAEAGNLAAAVRWHSDHDPAPLPHLFRVLWPFWFLRDRMREARAWVMALVPGVGALEPHAQAELLWAATATAVEVGDDATAVQTRQRLIPLLGTVRDPYLHAACQLAVAWTSPLVGDFDGLSRHASLSLAEFHEQDEPFLTALAAGTAGWAELARGRFDAALAHLGELRRLGDRFDTAWVSAWSEGALATLGIVQDRLDEAEALLDEALNLALAARTTVTVTLCLVAFARLALARGDPGRAALLTGAAEGLRGRVGIRAWPMLRGSESTLIDQISQAQPAGEFDREFAAGTRLSQREAVAVARDHVQPAAPQP